jgi:hypothetical protein
VSGALKYNEHLRRQVHFVCKDKKNENINIDDTIIPNLESKLQSLYKLSIEHDINNVVIKNYYFNIDWNIQII